MKTKLLAVSLLILAFGINTAEAQNRRASGENNQYEKQERHTDGFSEKGNRNDDRHFNRRSNHGNFRSGHGMRDRQRNNFDRRGSGRKSYQCKKYDRRHNF
jgi:hypothetical protein